MQPIKTWTACNNTRKLESTWLNMNRVLHKTQHNSRGQRSARLEWTRDRKLTQQDKTWSMSVRTPDMEPKLSLNKTWVPGSEHQAPTWNKETRHTDLSTLEAACSQENKDMTGVSGISRPKWQNPDNNVMITLYFKKCFISTLWGCFLNIL